MKVSFLSCISFALAGVVSVDIHRDRINSKHVSRGNALFRELELKNSHSDVNGPITDVGMVYLATMFVGSDRQKVLPVLDTGSSDLWVMASSNPYCASEDCTGMKFDPSSSTTFENTSEPFNIEYLEEKGASGFLCKDTVEIGGASVKNAYLAVADEASITQDVFGVGYTAGEAVAKLDIDSGTYSNSYPNYPVSLKNEGLINTVAYSLYLNNMEAKDGTILFGGVDHAKYEGTLGILQTIVMLPEYVDFPTSLTVLLYSINVKSGDTACPLITDFAAPVLFDSGTSFGMLPNDTIGVMASAYGYKYNPEIGYFEGNCSLIDFDGFEFNFSGVNVTVPPESLLYPGPIDGECILAIQPAPTFLNVIMGDVFLRNFYIVYDLDNNQIALGQAKYTDESDIEEIGSTIPRATYAPTYSNTYFNLASTFHSPTCLGKTSTVTASNSWPTEAVAQSSLYYASPTPTASA